MADYELVIRLFEGRSFDKLPPNHAVRVQGVLCDLVQETSPANTTHGQVNFETLSSFTYLAVF
jgi:hypothetical protein